MTGAQAKELRVMSQQIARCEFWNNKLRVIPSQRDASQLLCEFQTNKFASYKTTESMRCKSAT